MIDPLERCARIARDAALWYHVDAAWGGALIASDRLRGALAGMEHADSITIDAHKWFATTMGCGMFMTRHASDPVLGVPRLDDLHALEQRQSRSLRDDRAVVAAISGPAAVSVARGGGMGGLRRACGTRDRVDGVLKEELAERGAGPSPTTQRLRCCASHRRPVTGTSALSSPHVMPRARAWVAAAKFEGRDIIRVCLTHGEATSAGHPRARRARSAPRH